jgi:hypothetical protein
MDNIQNNTHSWKRFGVYLRGDPRLSLDPQGILMQGSDWKKDGKQYTTVFVDDLIMCSRSSLYSDLSHECYDFHALRPLLFYGTKT